MDLKTVKAAGVVSLREVLPETIYNGKVEKATPPTIKIKDRLALLNGAFPMDEAIVEGIIFVSTPSFFRL